MIEKFVVCTLVVNEAHHILLVRNPAWGNRLSIPTRGIDSPHESMAAAALASLRDDTGLPLPRARVVPIGYVGSGGRSERTGETTLYHYWVFLAECGESISLPTACVAVLDADQIASSPDVTWTAREVVAALFQSQEAAIAVVTRPGRTGTEYLLLWNENYEGFFFPAARVTAEFPPTSSARALARAELGYSGPVEVTEVGEVPEFQFSPRWGFERAYRFHIVRLAFPSRGGDVMDLHRPNGPVEQLLRAAERRRGREESELPVGWSWRWLTADQLRDPPPGVQLSGTMAAVRASVLATVPPTAGSLRRSEGSVALIRDDSSGTKRWLAQWNPGWKAYALVGGHREAAESFQTCAIREVREELDIPAGEPDGFDITAELEPGRYVAWSRSAAAYTDYDLHRFEVSLRPGRRAVLDRSAATLDLRWLTEGEIRSEETTDGRRVSETVALLI